MFFLLSERIVESKCMQCLGSVGLTLGGVVQMMQLRGVLATGNGHIDDLTPSGN